MNLLKGIAATGGVFAGVTAVVGWLILVIGLGETRYIPNALLWTAGALVGFGIYKALDSAQSPASAHSSEPRKDDQRTSQQDGSDPISADDRSSNPLLEFQSIVRSYASIDAAKAAQDRFASRSLMTETWAAMGEQWGLHSADSRSEVEALLAQGAPIDGVAKIDYGDGLVHWECPLLTALIDGRHRVAAALLHFGADVDAPNAVILSTGFVLNHTPLHMLAQRGDTEGASYLISKGADARRRTNLGTTPLHFAAGKDNAGLASILLKAGANPSAREFNSDHPSGWGETPFDQAGPTVRALLGSRSWTHL